MCSCSSWAILRPSLPCQSVTFRATCRSKETCPRQVDDAEAAAPEHTQISKSSICSPGVSTSRRPRQAGAERSRGGPSQAGAGELGVQPRFDRHAASAAAAMAWTSASPSKA